MNKVNLKSYAPQARKDFITAVTARASLLGVTAEHVSPATVSGGVAIIDGMEWPAKVAAQRQALLDRIARHGQGAQHTINPAAFQQTMEEVAYTWFNRLVALRYMEIHELLDHGHRVLSSRDGGLPELLRHAAEVSLPGLQAARVQELQLAGNQDNALYKLLLVAQCNELSRSMPFLFERIDDDTELLLPDNLLRTDSIIAKLVAGVPEDDWQEIEVIGWLYQFYISEKKDQVIGKVVKSEDIPAATQLFTPNWIVQYLVQNSVGRLWLMANPQSTLAQEWPYYIQPAEQTPEVQAQLDALIQTRVREDGDTLNPETITVLDPACGSGHILVVAYDVLKAIYLERGYRLRDIPRLILEKNLFGLDIDDRAAQLAGFALLMKARADDRRLLADPANPPKLNLLSLQESKALNVDDAATHLAPFGVQRATVRALAEAFEHAKTFGSLIQIPYTLKSHLNALAGVLELVQQSGDMYAKGAAAELAPVVRQAQVLAMQFDAVVANPPYMGGKGMNPALKDYAKATFPDSKSDLFAMFMERGFEWCKPTGFNSMVTMQSWMFLSSYEAMREKLLTRRTIQTMAHLGARAFAEISGEVVQTTAFVLQGQHFSGFKPAFFRLVDGQEKEKEAALRTKQKRFDATAQDDFKKIPGSPVAYWVSKLIVDIFSSSRKLREISIPRQGNTTTNNAKFVRGWYEVEFIKIGLGFESANDFMENKKKWCPYNKGGGSGKWYGLNESLVNWENNGKEIREIPHSVIANEGEYFKPGITFSTVSSSGFGFRSFDNGFIFDNKGASIFIDGEQKYYLISLLNSLIFSETIHKISPTVSLQPGDVSKMPVVIANDEQRALIVKNSIQAISVSKDDWDSHEESWDFAYQPLIATGSNKSVLSHTWKQWGIRCAERVEQLRLLEEENNRIFINAYGLQEELSPEVPEDQITLTRADREKDCQRLISYAIGCMMGRYSLDDSGLIYAHAGNVGFDPSRYTRFAADADGILPVTDEHWFADDAPERIREFLLAVWGPDTLEENMAWLAESLGAKAAETPAETIRRYIADKFFKDHLQTYKKRPIYWLFSSGKQGAFQALVYLHRYNESTLARMRAEYVIPLTAKMAARLEMLEQDATAATSTAARTKLRKQIETLRKKQAELLAYDEKLRHHADMRITLDLDDGVKVNYGKFGDLLEGVKVVTGGSGDE